MLREEWRSCVKCELGMRRISAEGEFVFGEGQRNGVMFVGEGPGRNEEQHGRPFIGDSGKILRAVIDRLGLQNYYITNIVACRSCSPFTDQATGQPIFRKNWKTRQMEPAYKDEPPTPIQIEACRPRLEEEIYLVDPVIIVALGATAAKTLLKKAVAITAPDVRGVPVHITIPGAGFRAVRTDKKDAWLRKGKADALPVEPSEVRYLCMPTLHPAFVARKLADMGGDSPFAQFTNDVRKAVQIYERYMLELYGTLPSGMSDNQVDIQPEDIHPQE